MKFTTKNLKILIIIAVIYLIIMIIIILNIYGSNKQHKEMFNYNEYSEKQINDEFEKIYFNKISSYLTSRNSDALYELISKDFLESKKITKSNITTYMNNNLYYGSPNVIDNGYQIINSTEGTIYSINVSIGRLPKVINVIEKAPLDFSIDFNNDYSSELNRRRF